MKNSIFQTGVQKEGISINYPTTNTNTMGNKASRDRKQKIKTECTVFMLGIGGSGKSTFGKKFKFRMFIWNYKFPIRFSISFFINFNFIRI